MPQDFVNRPDWERDSRQNGLTDEQKRKESTDIGIQALKGISGKNSGAVQKHNQRVDTASQNAQRQIDINRLDDNLKKDEQRRIAASELNKSWRNLINEMSATKKAFYGAEGNKNYPNIAKKIDEFKQRYETAKSHGISLPDMPEFEKQHIGSESYDPRYLNFDPEEVYGVKGNVDHNFSFIDPAYASKMRENEREYIEKLRNKNLERYLPENEEDRQDYLNEVKEYLQGKTEKWPYFMETNFLGGKNFDHYFNNAVKEYERLAKASYNDETSQYRKFGKKADPFNILNYPIMPSFLEDVMLNEYSKDYKQKADAMRQMGLEKEADIPEMLQMPRRPFNIYYTPSFHGLDFINMDKPSAEPEHESVPRSVQRAEKAKERIREEAQKQKEEEDTYDF